MWWLVYRMGGRAAKKEWLKLGEFSDLPLVRARKTARSHRVDVESGVNPRAKIREAEARGMTVEDAVVKFKAEYLRPPLSASTQSGYRSTLDIYIVPGLGKVALSELDRDKVTRWHREIEKPIAANRALATLSVLMAQVVDVWQIPGVEINPCLRVKRNPENARLRDIQTHELQAIGQALRDLQGNHSLWAVAAIKVVLLCWGRVSEVLGLRRDRDVFLAEGYALIRDHKGKRLGAKRLELPPQAVKILKGLPEEKGNPHYFPGRTKGTALTRNGLHKVWMAVCEKAGITDLHLHDSRSLAASEAEAQGVPPATAAALLGHRDARTAQKHYTRVRRAREAAASVSAPIAVALGE